MNRIRIQLRRPRVMSNTIIWSYTSSLKNRWLVEYSEEAKANEPLFHIAIHWTERVLVSVLFCFISEVVCWRNEKNMCYRGPIRSVFVLLFCSVFSRKIPTKNSRTFHFLIPLSKFRSHRETRLHMTCQLRKKMKNIIISKWY